MYFLYTIKSSIAQKINKYFFYKKYHRKKYIRLHLKKLIYIGYFRQNGIYIQLNAHLVITLNMKKKKTISSQSS